MKREFQLTQYWEMTTKVVIFCFFTVFTIQAALPSKGYHGDDGGFTNYHWNYSGDENPKFTQEQEMASIFERLCRQCEQHKTKGAPKAQVLDTAYELVNSNEEYKRSQDPLDLFFFKHPHLRDASLVAAGAAGALFAYWVFSS